jgi:hypothetical protein
MDTLEDVSAIMMKITRMYGWSLFKMLDAVNCTSESDFEKFIKKSSGR